MIRYIVLWMMSVGPSVRIFVSDGVTVSMRNDMSLRFAIILAAFTLRWFSAN